jgi:transketolase
MGGGLFEQTKKEPSPDEEVEPAAPKGESPSPGTTSIGSGIRIPNKVSERSQGTVAAVAPTSDHSEKIPLPAPSSLIRRSRDQLCINTIRTLAMDAVQAANSGHPGTPMALAPVAYWLWNRVLRFDPDSPLWSDRDRFVLSAGHASMLLYALLHLCEVKAVNGQYEQAGELSVTLDDIKRFRQLNSKCPGHPEYRWTSGIEATTGPLGQGVATSVGMAMAQRWMAAYFNRPGFPMFTYNTYALCGDGCLMEGVASEAASLAGHHKLSNLCWIYDNNKITIEGQTRLAFSEDVATRFMAYGWNVTRVADANDLEMLDRAFSVFLQEQERPTLLIVDSHIGYGAPHKQDSHAAHGEPLGGEEIRLTKRNYGWPEDAQFLIPPEVPGHFHHGIQKRGRALQDEWVRCFGEYQVQYPDLADQLIKMQFRQLPEAWETGLPVFAPDEKGVAGREASGMVLNSLANNVPWLIGGSADLAPSTKTRLTFEGAGDFSRESPSGRNLHFGVREHAMGAILNGLAVSKVRPYGSGFLIFSDYAKPAIRLSALMEIPVIHIFTHDSIGVGEDGPTHQPIEQLAALRTIPGLITIRPGDANEIAESWKVIMQLQHEPVALILSRQLMPTLDRRRYASATGVAQGAYVLADTTDHQPGVILIGTGSEVALCVAAHELLEQQGIKSRVVSMPSWELFERQDQDYRDSVLPPHVTARVGVEQASTFGWDRYVGSHGHMIGMTSFGASAPLKELAKKFGFTVEHVVQAAIKQIEKKSRIPLVSPATMVLEPMPQVEIAEATEPLEMKEPDEDSPVENTVQPVEEMEITEEEHSGPENGIMTGTEVQVSDELEQAEEESKPIQEILDPDMVATRSIFTRKTRS